MKPEELIQAMIKATEGKQFKGLIEDWKLIQIPFSDGIQTCVLGTLNGRLIRTSPVVMMLQTRVITENSLYNLGKPKEA